MQASDRDVGECRQAEVVPQSRDFYEALIKAQCALGEGILLIEAKCIRYANEAFCLMSGYSLEELRALRSCSELAAEDQRLELERWMRRCLDGEDIDERYQTTVLHKSGRQVVLELGAKPLCWEGRASHLVAVVRDLTARKRVEDRLQSSLGMLMAVHEAGRVLGSSLDSKEIGEILLKVMHRVSDLDIGILRIRDQRGRLSVVHACGPQGLLQPTSATSQARDARIRALETREYRGPFRLEQPKEDGMPVVGLCFPLIAQERVIGVIEAYGSEALVNTITIETMQSIANQAASALENARLYQELAERERRLRELVDKLIGAKEEERRRVAYEVHDGLTQVAIVAHQHLQGFAKDYLPNSSSDQTRLDHTLELAQQTVREARSVIAGLRPADLEDFGLAAALRSRVEWLRENGWEIGYDEALGDERLPGNIEIVLYRVTQEALINIRKHARTTWANITLVRRAKSVYLEVRDWGQGFEQRVVPKLSRLGVQTGICCMRERVALLSGDFRICSRPGEGTRVIAEVPLPTSNGVDERAG